MHYFTFSKSMETTQTPRKSYPSFISQHIALHLLALSRSGCHMLVCV